MSKRYDVVAVGAHPDDVEVFMGGTVVKLGRMGHSVLLVDLCPGEPARYGRLGERGEQAKRAAAVLGADRITLEFQDRLIEDTVEARVAVAGVIRTYRPRMVFTSEGCGVHPDHNAVTHIVTNGVFYARLPKWDVVAGASALADTEPHEIDRLFFGHCRMEAPWARFDFAVDVSDFYDVKLAALAAYEAVFGDDVGGLVDRYAAEDRYVGSLVGVRYPEAFKGRAPLLVADPTVFLRARYG